MRRIARLQIVDAIGFVLVESDGVPARRRGDVGVIEAALDVDVLPVFVADDPLTSVVLGAGKMLSDFALLKRVKWENTLQY